MRMIDYPRVWIVGEYRSRQQSGWYFCGVFLTKNQALAAAMKYDDLTLVFVGPARLGYDIPKGVVTWPGSFIVSEYLRKEKTKIRDKSDKKRVKAALIDVTGLSPEEAKKKIADAIREGKEPWTKKGI